MDSFLSVAQERAQHEASATAFKNRSRSSHPIDAELEEILSRQKTKIKVIGCGGSGNNSINRMTEVGIVGAETIANLAHLY